MESTIPSDVLAEIFARVDKLAFVIPRVCVSWRNVYHIINPPLPSYDDYQGCDFFLLLDQITSGDYGSNDSADNVVRPDVCAKCIEENNLELLKWVVDDGHVIQNPRSAAHHAARNNKQAILRWMVSYGVFPDDYISQCAAQFGNLDLVNWLRKKGARMTIDVFDSAFIGQHVDIMDYVHENALYDYPVDYGHYMEVDRFATAESRRWLISHHYLQV